MANISSRHAPLPALQTKPKILLMKILSVLIKRKKFLTLSKLIPAELVRSSCAHYVNTLVACKKQLILYIATVPQTKTSFGDHNLMTNSRNLLFHEGIMNYGDLSKVDFFVLA